MSSSVFIRSINVTNKYLTNRKCTFEELSLIHINAISKKEFFRQSFSALNATFYGCLSIFDIDDKKRLLWLLSDINFFWANTDNVFVDQRYPKLSIQCISSMTFLREEVECVLQFLSVKVGKTSMTTKI